MKVLISGGFGDSINQIGKLIYYCGNNNIKHEDVMITYCRDINDNEIVKASSPVTSDDYVDWVKTVAEVNNFNLDSVVNDQKKEAETGKYDIVLGPNMNYDIKIWEQQRQLFVGHRPNELQIIPDRVVNFMRYTLFFDIIVQVRFEDEWKTKSGSSLKNEVQLLRLLQNLDYKNNSIVLIGQSHKDLSKFNNIVSNHVNDIILNQYNLLLSARKFTVVNEGFGANLSLLAGIKTFRKRRDQLEFDLQTSSKMKEFCTLFDNYEDIRI